MNIVASLQQYVNKMVASVPGMKVLLLDKVTMGIVSLCMSQTEIMAREVYLFELLESDKRDVMAHLNAVVFVRPTDENVKLIERELRSPKYGQYHLFFSNTVRNSLLEEMAVGDENDVVQQVQEFFADVYATSPITFSLHLPAIFMDTRQAGWQAHQRRCVDGLLATLLALKKRPQVRYVTASEQCRSIANDLAKRINEEQNLFDFRQRGVEPLLLILDRKDDPVTPLLMQWTYEAMLHELLTLENNRVDLSHVPGVRKDMQQIVLNAEQDSFYRDHMYVNFGDLGVAIKSLVDKYQKKMKTNETMESLDDIKRFIEGFPEFRKMAGNASKHVALMNQLSTLIEERKLMPVSELQQEIANKHDHGTAKANVLDFVRNDEIKAEDKLRLVLLYALRYEDSSSNAVSDMIDELSANGVDHQHVRLISEIIEYAGSARRHGDVFSNKSVLSIMRGNIKRGLKGAQNVYTEHTPALLQTLDLALKAKLREADYPFALGSATREKPTDIIVFFVGGLTLEEAFQAHQWSEEQGVSVVLGGSCIHNSASFLKCVTEAKSAR